MQADPPGSLAILRAFAQIGATTFGGVWASTQKLETDLVDRSGWLERDDLKTLLVISTLIPAPKFLSLAGLVGFRVGGPLGALAAVVGLLTPAAAVVLAAVTLVQPAFLAGPLAPLNTTIGVTVVGLLFGNAVHQLRNAGAPLRDKVIGSTLSAGMFAAIAAGAPLVAVAVIGFLVGPLIIGTSRSSEGRT